MRTILDPKTPRPEEPCARLASVTLPDEATSLSDLVEAYASGQRLVDVSQHYFDLTDSSGIDLAALQFRPSDDDLAYQYQHLEDMHAAAQAAAKQQEEEQAAAAAAAAAAQAGGQPPAVNAATAAASGAAATPQGSEANNGGMSAAPEGHPSA